jgi:fructose-bisphosphate aldolase, class I
MKVTQRVKKILSWYESDNPGTKANIARLLMQGKLAGSGKLVILPVDQGFEHGPARSFAVNPDSYDPHYHYQMAVDAGLSAYAAPLGMLEAGADSFAGAIPLILKMNSSNSLAAHQEGPNQAVTASVTDALRLGCSAIGFTIYPGSERCYDMMEEIRQLSAEAKSYGIATVIWSYARGSMSKTGETAVDIISYGAHMATLLGAHIIKVKLPTDALELDAAKKAYLENKIAIGSQADRVADVVRSCFNGRRLVVFSGGEAKTLGDVYKDIQAIRDGGGHGSIIGRNAFQRPHAEAMDMFKHIIDILLGREDASAAGKRKAA